MALTEDERRRLRNELRARTNAYRTMVQGELPYDQIYAEAIARAGLAGRVTSDDLLAALRDHQELTAVHATLMAAVRREGVSASPDREARDVFTELAGRLSVTLGPDLLRAVGIEGDVRALWDLYAPELE